MYLNGGSHEQKNETLIGVAIIGLVLSAVSAFAVGYGPGCGGCGMRGMMGGGYSANVSDADYQKFLAETSAQRKSIAVDRPSWTP